MIAHSKASARLERGRRTERLLGSTGLFDALDSYRGTLNAAGLLAEVAVESAECVRLTCCPEAPPTGRAALERSSGLSGNARLACTQDGIVLIADTELDDGAHLAPTLRAVLESYAALESAAHGTGASRARDASLPALEQERITNGLREVAFGDGGVLALENGWEVRPRLRGAASPVRLAIVGRELRFRRTVHKLGDAPVAPFVDAAMDVALRLNLRMRGARLVLADNVLIAEAYLHETQLHGRWIASTARAVAAAERLAREPLELLDRNPDVADGYAQLFLT